MIGNALVWAPESIGERGQRVVSAIPVEYRRKVRWLTNVAVIQDKAGNDIRTDGQLRIATELEIGSIVWDGLLDDLPGTGTAAPTSGLLEVVADMSTDDLKGRNTCYMYGLQRYSGVLPCYGN